MVIEKSQVMFTAFCKLYNLVGRPLLNEKFIMHSLIFHIMADKHCNDINHFQSVLLTSLYFNNDIPHRFY